LSNWRRAFCPGGTFFFTLATERRAPVFTTPRGRSILRTVTEGCRQRWPFEILAIVLLPDHLHALWRIPDGDSAYPRRWAWIKKEFTQQWLAEGGREQPISGSRSKEGRRGVLQRRYWEHMIRDETDHKRHVDIHYNPVKHGHASCPAEWPWSSFHRYLRAGVYSSDWGCTRMTFDDIDASVRE
jgi:putative transposase